MFISHWRRDYDLLNELNWVMIDVLNYMCVIVAD